MNIPESDKMQMAKVMLNHADAVVIDSGNVLNWYNLKKGIGHKSSDEFLMSMETAISAWTSSMGSKLMSIQAPMSVLGIENKELGRSFSKEPREKLKITAKIFLSHWRPSLVKEAVERVCSSLGVSNLDTVIVSFPVTILAGYEENDSTTQMTADLERVKPVWKEMEGLMKRDLAFHIGVSDFDKIALEELHQWADLKPTINQVYMDNCCNIPCDILEFSKKHDIELLSHTDGPELVSDKSLQCLLHAVVEENLHEWSPLYAVRYAVIARCRGIVEAKGYLLGAERNSSSGIGDLRLI